MKNMFKKIMLMVLVAGVALTSNVFAANVEIEANGLEVTINGEFNREDKLEVYEIKANESLEKLNLVFSEKNNFSIEKVEGNWTISLTYMEINYTTDEVKKMTLEVLEKESIEITGLSEYGVTIIVSEDLSKELFDKIFEINAPFTLSAESTGGKTIEMKRNPKDEYILSSNQELGSAKITDGSNWLEVSKNNGTYNISGKYKTIEIDKKNISIPPGSGFLINKYGIKFAVAFHSDEKGITITPDPSVIQKIKEEIENRMEAETTISGDDPLDISSNSNIENVVVSENVQSPQIKLPATIANELTIESKNTGTRMVFPEGLGITGLNEGIMNLPKIEKVSIPSKGNKTRTSSLAINVGTAGTVTFNKPVTLIFPNMKGKNVGFFDGEEFIEITNTCNSSFSSGECKINDGNDLIVRTYHFTTFAVYTETIISTGGGGTTTLNISNVDVKTDNTEAIISFNASESSSAVLKYGTSAGNYTSEVEESEFKTSHTFNLKNLSNQKYYYRIEVKNSEGSSANYSGDFTIQTTTSKDDQIETSTKVKEQGTYNYNGIITTKPLEEMNKEELFRVFLILLLKSLLAQRGITL